MPLIITPPSPRRRRGSTLVEAAIVLPLLILVVFGLIEYGSLLLRLQQIENVTRQAARYAATPDATQALTVSRISSMMTTAGLGSSGYTVTYTPTDISTAARGDQITIKISLTYNNIAITKSSLIPVPTTLTRTVVMAKEGP